MVKTSPTEGRGSSDTDSTALPNPSSATSPASGYRRLTPSKIESLWNDKRGWLRYAEERYQRKYGDKTGG